MNQVLILTPLLAYLLALMVMLWREMKAQQSRPEANSAREEALGTRNYGTVAVAMTLIGSNLGPADTLGLSDQAKKVGFFFLMFPVLAGLQQIICGLFFAEKIRQHSADCMTVGDILATRFSRLTQLFAGLVTVAQALAFTGILCLAGGQVLHAFFGWHQSYGVVFTAIFVGTYTALGGMNAVIKTDILQFWVIVAGASLAVLGAILLLARSPFPIPQEWFWRPDPQEFTARNMLTLGAGYFLGEAFLPMYSIRALITGARASARRAFVAFGGGIALYYVAMMLVGISANVLQGSGTGTEMVFVDVVSSLGGSTPFRWFLAGISMTALMGLTHSTLDSVLNAGATALVRDVVGAYFPLSDSSQRGFMKRGIIVISLLGTIFSVLSNDLIDILMIGYTVWVPTIVIPFGYVLLRGSQVRWRHSATVGILAGVVGLVVGSKLPMIAIPPILVGFIANGIAFSVAELTHSAQAEDVKLAVG
jgi:solute:Na+ symporter, SSS family